jgi:tetratricopeptide (TPR) repeat protein
MGCSGVKVFLLLTALTSALSACTTTIRGPELSLEYYNLGNAYYDLTDYDKSILYFQKAISIDNENRKAYFNLALAFIAAGRAAEAQGVLEDLIVQDPDNQSLMEALAFAYYVQEENEKAIEIYRRVLEVSPENKKARYNLGILLWKQEDGEAALEAFVTILENDPEDLEALYHQGELLLQLNRPAEAAEVLEAYLQKQPDSAAAYMHLGDAYRILERYDKALEAYGQALIYDEKRGDAWFYSAVIQLTRIEDPDRGLTALAEALEAGFKDSEQIAELLSASELLERDKVTALLQRQGLLPEAEKTEQQ